MTGLGPFPDQLINLGELPPPRAHPPTQGSSLAPDLCLRRPSPAQQQDSLVVCELTQAPHLFLNQYGVLILDTGD